jgi:hypothetical protein
LLFNNSSRQQLDQQQQQQQLRQTFFHCFDQFNNLHERTFLADCLMISSLVRDMTLNSCIGVTAYAAIKLNI